MAKRTDSVVKYETITIGPDDLAFHDLSQEDMKWFSDHEYRDILIRPLTLEEYADHGLDVDGTDHVRIRRVFKLEYFDGQE